MADDAKPHMDHSPFIVAAGQKVDLATFSTDTTGDLKDKKEGVEALKADKKLLRDAQALIWANAERSLLIIFQALDAAGKDGAIKHVMTGMNPQGVDVTSFAAPSEEERKHHFLWRPMQHLPARGRVGIFNRSYYEEVLVVRVHPHFLDSQVLPQRQRDIPREELWQQRYDEINQFEQELVNNDVSVLKFFLHVSKDEQKERFIERLKNPEKNWKFSAGDLRERRLWDDYQVAFEDMLSATSTEAAPWHVIPADKKWFARALIADIIAKHVDGLNLKAPEMTPEQKEELEVAKKEMGLDI